MKKILFYLTAGLLVTSSSSCTNADSAKTGSEQMSSEEIVEVQQNTGSDIKNQVASTETGGDAEAPAAPESSSSDKAKEEKTTGPNLSTTESQLSYMQNSSNWEKYNSGILPTMAEEVPEYCQKILEKDAKRFLIVDKAKMKVFLYDKYGNEEKSYAIACAKNYGTKHRKGDSRTTEGIFEVEGIYDSTNWLFTNDAGYTSPKKGAYGPRFIRLTTPAIGIHGTGTPSSIGKRCSHGCIRTKNENILELVKYVEAGMPVIISPGPKDMSVNKKEGYDVPSVTTEPGTPRAVPGNSATTVTTTTTTKSSASTGSSRSTNSSGTETASSNEVETNAAIEAVESSKEVAAPAPKEESAPTETVKSEELN